MVEGEGVELARKSNCNQETLFAECPCPAPLPPPGGGGGGGGGGCGALCRQHGGDARKQNHLMELLTSDEWAAIKRACVCVCVACVCEDGV